MGEQDQVQEDKDAVKKIAASDQGLALARDFLPTAVRGFYCGLKREGFDHDNAFTLTRDYVCSFLGGRRQ